MNIYVYILLCYKLELNSTYNITFHIFTQLSHSATFTCLLIAADLSQPRHLEHYHLSPSHFVITSFTILQIPPMYLRTTVL